MDCKVFILLTQILQQLLLKFFPSLKMRDFLVVKWRSFVAAFRVEQLKIMFCVDLWRNGRVTSTDIFTEVYYTWELNVHAKSFQISNFWLIEFTIFVHAHVYAFLQSTCLTLISMSFVYHTQSSSRLTAVDQSSSNASFKKSRAPVACKDSVMFSRT